MARILRMPTPEDRIGRVPERTGRRTDAPRSRRIDPAPVPQHRQAVRWASDDRRPPCLAAPRSQARQQWRAIAFFRSRHRLEKPMKTGTVTRTLVLGALMLPLGIAGVSAQDAQQSSATSK